MKHLSLFTKARLKLTFFYILIFLTISGVISSLFYYNTSKVLEFEYDRLGRRIQMEMNSGIMPGGPRITIQNIQPEDLAIAKQKIIIQLIRINGFLALLVAVSGYLLSGLTLAPIEASMKEQKRFISDASHELKTPITALKTSLEVNLMNKSLPVATKSILKENLNDVKSLESLTTSLLRLSTGNSQLNQQKIDLNEVIAKAIKHLTPLAKKKKITIENSIQKKPIFVCGDKPSLVELFIIFIDNAVKYSPTQSKISLLASNHKETVNILVNDQGIGIDKKDLPYIFDRFYRADQSRTKTNIEGFGLGLSVAEKIMSRHHGCIDVKSAAGKGTSFTLTFPRYKMTS